jgi:hypothetical protein
MTGAPGETWRKFRFARVPPVWAFAGDPFGGLLWGVIRDRVSGRLPLTQRSNRTVTLALWVPRALIVGPLVLWILGANLGLGSDPSNELVSIGWFVFFVIGLPSLMAGLVGAFLVKPLICPRGRLIPTRDDEADIVELRNVHPTFVAAVYEMHNAFSPAVESTRTPAIPSLRPGSN